MLAAAGVVKMKPLPDRRVLRHDDLQPSSRAIGAHKVFLHEGQAESVACGGDHIVDIVENQPSFDPDVQLAAMIVQLPWVKAAMCRQSQVDAIVVSQIDRPFVDWAGAELARRTDDDKSDIRADPGRDHVARHLRAEAHTGVETFGHDILQVVGDA